MSTILPPALRLSPPPANLGDILIRLREQVFEITGDLSHLGEQLVGVEFDYTHDFSRYDLKAGVRADDDRRRFLCFEVATGNTPEEALARFREEWAKNAEVRKLVEEGKIKPAAPAAGKWVWVADEAGKETARHG